MRLLIVLLVLVLGCGEMSARPLPVPETPLTEYTIGVFDSTVRADHGYWRIPIDYAPSTTLHFKESGEWMQLQQDDTTKVYIRIKSNEIAIYDPGLFLAGKVYRIIQVGI